LSWETRAVFLSSTFADMQAERDHLRNHVFPELEERLRARRQHLEWVDLRLGVATAGIEDAEKRELHVLKVCLAEVRRCRPFLIVLLGERYGWVPPEQRIAAAASEEGFSADVVGRSVTDLEIRFGVLANREQQPRSFFYFRDPLPCGEMPAAVAEQYSEEFATDPSAADRAKQLAELKRDIELRCPERVRRYSAGWDNRHGGVIGLESWGRQVLDDLWAELDRETSAQAAATELPWQQVERTALDDYIEDRARGFVGRNPVLQRLEAVATSAVGEGSAWGICLTGGPGCGKSAIFGELYRRLGAGGAFLLAHAAGASPRAPSTEDMLVRWIDELGAALGTDPQLPDGADPETIQITFSRLLDRIAAQRRVVVLIDALDQFAQTTSARFMTWLPRHWPDNARLIATAIAGEASIALGERAGIETMPVLPLDAQEARQIVEGICGRYHRTLEPEVLDALLTRTGPDGPAWGNTLWLVLAVEELNLIDADDFARARRAYHGAPAEQLRALLLDATAALPNDIPGLYQATFDHAEEVFGIPITRAFLASICIGRGGWRESDLRVLMPRLSGEAWDELRFASLRRLFRGQQRQRGALGQWDFTHGQMRLAVRQRLAALGVPDASLHAVVADHLIALAPDDPLRQSETMVHLLGCRDWQRAAAFYGDVDLTAGELEGAQRVLTQSVLAVPGEDEAGGLGPLIRLLAAAAESKPAIGVGAARAVAKRMTDNLDATLTDRASIDVRIALMHAIRRVDEQLVEEAPDAAAWKRLAGSEQRIGDLLRAQGDLRGALASYNKQHSISLRLVEMDRRRAGSWDALSHSYQRIGVLHFEQGRLDDALAAFESCADIAQQLATEHPSNANLQRKLSIALDLCAQAKFQQGMLDPALGAYEQALSIRERLAEADPGDHECQSELARSHRSMGDVLLEQGRLSDAETAYRTSLTIRERLSRYDPTNADWQNNVAESLDGLGAVLVKEGRLSDALEAYERSLAVGRRLVDTDFRNTGWQRDVANALNRIGDLYVRQGDLGKALAAFVDCRHRVQRLVEHDPSNAAWHCDLGFSLVRIGFVHRVQGNLPDALAAYRESLAIREELSRHAPANAEWQHDVSVSLTTVGGVLAEQGQLTDALEAYERALAIGRRLVATDSGNLAWQRDVVTALNRIGDIWLEQGDLERALAAYTDSQQAAQSLIAADPGNTTWQSDLALSYTKMGDIHRDQGDHADALSAYRHAFAIRQRLARSDLNNTEWQMDWAHAIDNIGKMLEAQGDHFLALAAFEDALVIKECLVEVDPGNADWLRDLSFSHSDIGRIRAVQGELEWALEAYQSSLSIVERLAEANPGNADLQREVWVTRVRTGDLLLRQDDLPGAQAAYEAALAMSERLADRHPSDVDAQHDLALCLRRIGSLAGSQGDRDAARNHVLRGIQVMRDVVRAAPDSAAYRRTREWFESQLAELA
jgi:tetratricopeptide (TPR) repeat protein